MKNINRFHGMLLDYRVRMFKKNTTRKPYNDAIYRDVDSKVERRWPHLRFGPVYALFFE